MTLLIHVSCCQVLPNSQRTHRDKELLSACLSISSFSSFSLFITPQSQDSLPLWALSSLELFQRHCTQSPVIQGMAGMSRVPHPIPCLLGPPHVSPPYPPFWVLSSSTSLKTTEPREHNDHHVYANEECAVNSTQGESSGKEGAN